MTEIAFASAIDLRAAVRTRTLSPVEIADTLLERLAQVNPALNAYVHVDPERVRARAHLLEEAVMRGEPLGPLHGVPYSIKEMTPVAGLPHTLGLVPFKDQIATTSAVIARRLDAAGGLLLGKTNMPEAGYYGATDGHLFGPTRNPWRLDRIAGGSSGGAAAAVAAGLGPLADGSDGAGSVRIPASCCGVVGLKPSLGRIPQQLTLGRFSTFLHHGPLARTVADATLMLSVVEGFDASDPLALPPSGVDWLAEIRKDVRGWRVAWSPNLGFATVDPEIAHLCGEAVRVFADLGCTVEESHPAWGDPEEAMWHGVWLPAFAGARDLFDPAEWEGKIDANLLALVEEGARQPGIVIARAEMFRALMWDAFVEWFAHRDLLVTPTLCIEPFAVGRFTAPHLATAPLRTQILGWLLTYPFNLMASAPAVTIPCGFTASGLPVGLQLVGPPRADAAVLRAAACFERARPWANRRPSV
jgi:aspartyl-tRNA(Asn)/glutamyl-tRNA(Gln) amidotransferase subunit A